MTKIISIANRKGGVGKTTTVSVVGGVLADKGQKVLLVDLDSQSNLTKSLLKETPSYTIFESMRDLAPLPIVSIRDGLDIVPSHRNMAQIDSGLESATVLKELIEPIKKKYDYILIDCPPSLGSSVINALSVSTDYIITLRPEPLPLMGITDLTDIADKVKESLNPNLSLSGIVLTMWDGRKKLYSLIDSALRKQYGEKVFLTKIRSSVSVAEAPLYSQEVGVYAPQSNGYKDYVELTEELLSRM